MLNIIIKRKNAFIILFLITLFVLILLNPEILISSVISSTNLFINKLFTTLFPFFILTELLLNYNFHIYTSNVFKGIFSKLFNISNTSSSIIILSLLTGNPSNAKYIKDYLDNNLITKEEAYKLLTFTFIPSPSFTIMVVGYGIFNNKNLGILLLLLIYCYNFIIGIFFKDKIKINKNNNIEIINIKNDISSILKKAIVNSFNTLMIILGNIIIFTIIFNIFQKYINLNKYCFSFISSLLELTNGIKNISVLNTNINIKIAFIIFPLMFEGLSIYLQASSILSEYKINIKKIIKYRFIFSIVFSLITYLLLEFIHLLH